jgi:prolyl-tRNA editing enzyme YbaK/EbsC (Cys-tRNA(Pro) deacylase)
MEYVSALAKEFGISPIIIQHPRATSTCYEKAELLGWQPQRVVKAIYAAVDDDICGFIFPELGQKLTEEDVKRFYSQAGAETEEYYLQMSKWYIPQSMEIGTCTPFLLESDMKIVDHIFVREVPSLDDQIVDISIGGKGQQAHRTSMHLPYSGIHRILSAKYGERIHKVV